ncbi:MAG: DUF1073 domain-containing protein [Spirochaetaceae bacterium]|nr:DUF1073 domain-containing protein [Spirochaetaceae bacterium]
MLHENGLKELIGIKKLDNEEFMNGGLITLSRRLLSSAFAKQSEIQTAITVPVDDALRGGLTLRCDELTNEQLNDVSHYLNEMAVLNTANSKRLRLQSPYQALKNAMLAAALYGGGAILIINDEPLNKPFFADKVNKDTILGFRALDRWQLGDKAHYYDENSEFVYNGITVDPSRLILLKGTDAPALYDKELKGWGLSDLERTLLPVRNWQKNQRVIYELLDEAKIDILKIDGLSEQLLTDSGTKRLSNLTETIARLKDYRSLLVLGSNDSYEQKQINFSGLPDILRENRITVASALRMPLTKLFGLSASGFSSGEEDMDNYYATIESVIRPRARRVLNELLPIALRKVCGFVPDYSYTFSNLKLVDIKEEEAVKVSKQNRLSALFKEGLLTKEEYTAALEREGLL